MDFEVKKLHIGVAVLLGIGVGALQYNCDSQGQAEAERQKARAEKVVELTPDQRLAYLKAKSGVHEATRRALYSGVREVNRQLHIKQSKHEQKAPSSENADVLTILFSANVHGEREDCGCKHNPLGGLTRRQTLIDLSDADSDGHKKWWGAKLPASDATFTVDAGDLLFKTTSLARHAAQRQEEAKTHAQAVVDALAVNPPDAINVGEIDLVFGLETYREYVSAAELPIISANLFDVDGERAFDGHRVVDIDGHKVAFVGLLKPKSRVPDYYKERKLEVRDPFKTYVEEVAKLPEEVDLVVLLSNLGINETSVLVEKLAAEKARVDAAVVSNTNQLTRSVTWSAGVPLVEPLSRGKYFGRLDLRLGDEPGIAYANALEDPRKVVQDYRRAWTGYFNARKQWSRTATTIEEMKKELAEQRERAQESDKKVARKSGGGDQKGAAKAEKGKAEKFVDSVAERTESRIAFLEKRLDTLQARIETTSKAVAGEAKGLGSMDDLVRYKDGDDWATARVVQVKLEIPEDQKVRNVLDRWK